MPKYEVDGEQLAIMMGRLGLAWDGQWFLKTVEKFDLDTAFELNTKVRESFARIEMREMLKILNKEKADDIEDALDMIIQYVYYAFGKDFHAERAEQDGETIVNVHHCTVYENCRRAGLPRADQCCVSCARMWPAWISRLLPEQEIAVTVHQQMGKGAERCLFSFTMKNNDE